jgi:class 3 adenylate cyclase
MATTVSPTSSASELERLGLAPRLPLVPRAFHPHTGSLPTGTVTLLMAEIEGSTRIWETQPDVMAIALATMDRTLADLVHANNGVCASARALKYGDLWKSAACSPWLKPQRRHRWLDGEAARGRQAGACRSRTKKP